MPDEARITNYQRHNAVVWWLLGDLKGNEARAYMAMLTYTDNLTGLAEASLSDLAKHMWTDEKAVSAAVHGLIAHRAIIRIKDGGGRGVKPVYQLPLVTAPSPLTKRFHNPPINSGGINGVVFPSGGKINPPKDSPQTPPVFPVNPPEKPEIPGVKTPPSVNTSKTSSTHNTPPPAAVWSQEAFELLRDKCSIAKVTARLLAGKFTFAEVHDVYKTAVNDRRIRNRAGYIVATLTQELEQRTAKKK